MGEKVRMARQELEDLYLGVPDGSVDLTFKDLVVRPPPAVAPARAAVSPAALAAIDEQLDDDERHGKAALLRSSTNIFTYKVESDTDDDGGQQHSATAASGFQLSPSPSPPPAVRGGRRSSRAIRPSAAAEGAEQQQRSGLRRNGGVGNYRRQGIPHSNMCALCDSYVHILRHRCLSCGRVYCRRCVGAGMGDMAEGRKCVDCLGRKYSHRYIHKAGRTSSTAAGLLCCCGLHGWGKGSSLRAQELLWAEKGAAPRRRQSSSSSTTSISDSYSTAAGGGGYSASMSMTMMSINSGAGARYNGNKTVVQPAPASSSFVANSTFSRSGANPHALPL